MPKKPQNTMSQTALKYYNQFRSVRAKAIRWLQITTNTGKKVKVETESREIYQKLLDFIKIEITEVEQQKSTENDIINLPMDPIVNISSSKHPMSWELINCRLLLPNESVMKSMFLHKNITRPQKTPPIIPMNHHAQYVLHQERQFSLEAKLLTPLTFNKYNF